MFFIHYLNNIIILLLPFIIEITIFTIISILVCIYLFNINIKINDDKFLLEFLIIILIFFVIILIYIFITNKELYFYFDKLYIIETNNILIKIFIIIQFILLCILWPVNKLLSNIKTTVKLLILLLLSILGLIIAINARDLMLLYAGIELASMPIYILVSNKEYMTSIEAGIKYYILGAISSCFFLLGVGLLYAWAGTTNYNQIYIYNLYSIYNGDYYMFLVFIFIIVLLLFKIGLYPFNFWVTNFNEGASLNIVFYLSIITKLPYIYILTLLYFFIFNISIIPKSYISLLLILSAFITILTSIIEGMSDNHLGRIIGQSSMINMSFIFIVIITFIMLQESFLIFIYILYLIPTLLLFGILSLRDIVLDKRNLTVIYDSFLFNNYITIALYFTLISLSGLPFLSGFVGKWYIFKLLINYDYILVVICLVILSIFINIFYIRIFFYILNRIRFNNFKIIKTNYLKYFLISILSYMNFFFIMLQEPLIGFILCLNI